MSLKDVIEAKVKAMPFEAVKDLLSDEKAAVACLERQVGDAIARGTTMNSPEVFRASDILKQKKLTIVALQKRLNELRRQHQTKAHISLERAFMTAAKRRLQPVIYAEILDEAKGMVEDDQETIVNVNR